MSSATVTNWVKVQDAKARYHSKQIALHEQSDWLFDGYLIRHRLTRFFSIVGLEYCNGSAPCTQPIILQPEIGCLGWVTRKTDAGLEFLLQAKYEPGNCGGTQIAPTVQATKSNQERIHGGAEVPFLTFFRNEAPAPTVDTLQTEESDRFYRKLNRNVSVQIEGELLHPEQFQWCGVPTLKRLLSLSHTVNTDARSVLACMDWRIFQDETSTDADLSTALRRSIDLNDDPWAVRQRLADARASFGAVRQIGLSELPGYRLTPIGLDAPDAPFSIRYFQVRTQLREVPEWSQPLVISHSAGLCLLLLSIEDGVVRVYLRIRQAPGVLDGAEIAPSLQLAPGQPPSALDSFDEPVLQAARDGRLLAEADNSQEGSRFFKDCIRYRIALVNRHEIRETDRAVWATLGTLKQFIDEGKIVSNEMRSAVSFLLPLL